jgi:hypothetical protein
MPELTDAFAAGYGVSFVKGRQVLLGDLLNLTVFIAVECFGREATK